MKLIKGVITEKKSRESERVCKQEHWQQDASSDSCFLVDSEDDINKLDEDTQLL